MTEKRRAHIAGISPATMIALTVSISSVIGGYYVMQADIENLKEALSEHKQDAKDIQKAIWLAITSHK